MGELVTRSVESLLRVLAFGQVEHECHALVSRSLKGCHANEHRHAASVFPKVLLLERRQASRHDELGHPAVFVAITPFGRRQFVPGHATCDEILTVVTQHGEERVVCLEDLAFEFEDEYPDD